RQIDRGDIRDRQDGPRQRSLNTHVTTSPILGQVTVAQHNRRQLPGGSAATAKVQRVRYHAARAPGARRKWAERGQLHATCPLPSIRHHSSTGTCPRDRSAVSSRLQQQAFPAVSLLPLRPNDSFWHGWLERSSPLRQTSSAAPNA